MKRFSVFAILALVATFAWNAVADELPMLTRDGFAGYHGGNMQSAKAGRDTILLMGPHRSDATWSYFGDFQDATGGPDWNGWTSHDLTDESEPKWSSSNYNADGLGGHGADNLAAWCGWDFAPCSPEDVVGGYGDQWYTWIEYAYTVPDTNVATTIVMDFYASYDMDWNFDPITPAYYDAYAIVQFYPDPVEGDSHLVGDWMGGKGINVRKNATITYDANTYYYNEDDEAIRDQVVLWILFDSSIWTSDENCTGADWTGGNGAIQIDDLELTITNGASAPVVYLEDFEDGTLGDWVEGYDANAVGDFANLRSNLNAIDECRFNGTTMVNFTDTGFYTDLGLDPMPGMTWQYGPGGYIVQNQGGLTFDEDYHLYNVIRSPALAWPDQEMDGCLLAFDWYLHMDLADVYPGIFTVFEMRGTTSMDPADIELSGFDGNGYVYYGGPGFSVREWEATERLPQGRTYVQVQLACWEIGYNWGFEGVDGTPAPYIDNVRVKVYPIAGPAMYQRSVDNANDDFPDIGTIDYSDLGANSCRWDMAQDISGVETFNDPGDSVIVEITPVRTGSTLARTPRIYFALHTGTDPDIFAAFRTNMPAGDYVEGWEVAPNTFAFDLPDSNFLFPGDILHFFYEGTDDLNGDQVSNTLPADTTGFGDFRTPLAYDTDFMYHALPTVREDGVGGYTHPEILFWNDYENRGGENEWHYALNNLGFQKGDRYDVYYTHAASSAVGNGLGGRATLSTIEGYTDILYTSGLFSDITISNGDGANNGDKGNDVGLLTSWFEEGNKDMFMTGDDLILDLATTGGLGTFLTTYVGVSFQDRDLRPLIDGQTTPLVVTIPGDPVFTSVDQWIAYGGCVGINTFDAVYAAAGATRLAEFTNSSGGTGAYDYSAATLFPNADFNSRVISMPYDLMLIYTDPDEFGGKAPATHPARTRVLKDVLAYFGHSELPGEATPVPDAGVFSARNYPNPFNPVTKIEFNMPRKGHLSVKIYNVRGELVRTLVDETRDAGAGFVMWDGTNDSGASQASGVYFYEARTAGDVKINKMALVK